MRILKFAAVGLVTICAVWLARDRVSASGERASMQAELMSLRQQLDSVAADAKKARAANQRRSAASQREREPAVADAEPSVPAIAPPTEPDDEANAAPPDTADSAQAEEEAEVEAHLARNEERFVAEPRDPAWADGARTKIEGFLQAPDGAGSKLSSVECRTSLCRAEVVHADDRERIRYVESVFKAGQTGLEPEQRWPGERMALRELRPDGSFVTVLYYAKEGQPFYEEPELP